MIVRAALIVCLGLACASSAGARSQGWLAVQFDPAGGPISRVDVDSGATSTLTAGIKAQALAWSRDGSKLLYTQFSGNTSYLGAVDAAGKPLAGVRVPEASYGTFAPDGRRVVFERICRTFLCIDDAHLDGSGSKTLVACAKKCLLYNPAWSPNGKQLGYARQRDAGGFTTTTIRIRNADGSGDHPLVAEGYPCSDQGSVRWSPDGTRIAFSCDDATYVVPSRGGRARRVCAGPVFAWAPDSRALACSQGDKNGLYFNGWVRIVDLASGKTRVLSKRHAYALAWHE